MPDLIAHLEYLSATLPPQMYTGRVCNYRPYQGYHEFCYFFLRRIHSLRTRVKLYFVVGTIHGVGCVFLDLSYMYRANG